MLPAIPIILKEAGKIIFRTGLPILVRKTIDVLFADKPKPKKKVAKKRRKVAKKRRLDNY